MTDPSSTDIDSALMVALVVVFGAVAVVLLAWALFAILDRRVFERKARRLHSSRSRAFEREECEREVREHIERELRRREQDPKHRPEELPEELATRYRSLLDPGTERPVLPPSDDPGAGFGAA